MKKYVGSFVGRHKVYLSFASSRKCNDDESDNSDDENISDVEATESIASDYDRIRDIRAWCRIDVEECVQKSKEFMRWLLDYASVRINLRISVSEYYVF